jgi:two-component system response regulator AtoC
MTDKCVLVVEAEPALRSELERLLQGWGYEPLSAGSPTEAQSRIGGRRLSFSVVDMDGNGANGIDVLRHLRLQGVDSGPVIMLCDSLGSHKVGEASGLDADDFLVKPFKPEELESAVRALRVDAARTSGRAGTDEVAQRLAQEMNLWRSPRMQEVRKVIEQTAQVDITVLICGETGTGKDLVARAVHHHSFRQRRPFVKVNCAAVPRELLESELFGHERGAFTGAHQLKIGKFEAADTGTMFLDEIGDLHPALQGKLLHVLQDGEFSRVGGRSTIKVDVRIIAATNQDLEKAVAAGRFREDLYYRLNVIQIVVPPLRERPEEIPRLINYFTERHSKLFNRTGFTIPSHIMEHLTRQSYPGNVRELENLVKRMIVLNDPLLTRTALPRVRAEESGNGVKELVGMQSLSLKQIARDAAMAAEREAISRVLDQTRWNRVKAAKLLKISYRALLYKIKQAGLESEQRSMKAAL